MENGSRLILPAMILKRFQVTPAVILALAIFALTAGEGFWHHHEKCERSDCAYCQFNRINVDSSHVVPPPAPGPPVVVSADLFIPFRVLPKTIFHSPFGRSPPFAS